MSAAAEATPAGYRALLADGSPVFIRPLVVGDLDAVDRLHRELPLQDRYDRFFTASTVGAQRVAASIVDVDSTAVGVFRSGCLVGVAHYLWGAGSPDPEVAVAVAHIEHRRGVASLLLEYLTSIARFRGVRRVTADVLTANHAMLQVLDDIGLPVTRTADAEITQVVLHLPPPAAGDALSCGYVDAVLDRESHADALSLRAVFAPRSVVVVGAGRRADSVGRAVLRAIVEGGFTGPVHVVNPHAAAVAGVPTHRSVADLPAGVDLAVVCVPAAAVAEVAQECGRRGVRALLVITAGISGTATEAALVAAVERYGMRMVGPNCLGLVNTDPAVCLQATFGGPAVAGDVGVAAQSGGVALALLADLDRLGLGVSTLVSTGDGADVTADDMALWWSEDGRTRAAVLYLESIRRPRQFAQLARRLALRIPVLTIRSGSSEVGRRAAASHSASGATPRVLRDALFDQAGIIAVDELSELTELLAVLRWQPLPAGGRVGILSNAGGAGVLAADACVRYGLVVAAPAPAIQDRLRTFLPLTAGTAGPVDTTATVDAATFGRCVEALLADPGIDAVLAVSVATAVGDPVTGLSPVALAGAGKPVLAVRLGQPSAVERIVSGGDLGHIDGAGPSLPSFAEPAAAARALSRAVGRSRWLRTAEAPPVSPSGVCAQDARAVVDAFLAEHPQGGWLDPERVDALLRSAGLPLAPVTVVTSGEAAVRAWRAHGGPVAVKADVPDVVHKSAVGGVRTGLDSRAEVVRAVREMRSRFGARLRGVVVQPMAERGPELIVGVTGNPLFGPLLTVGLGGTSTDLVEDRAHCLVPASAADVDGALGRLRCAARLFTPDRSARQRVAEVAHRTAWLADQLPELVEAEINPLVLTPDGVVAVDARMRLAPATTTDPWLRYLPT